MIVRAWLLCFLLIPAFASAQELGTITFPTSGEPAAQPKFLEGVKALHSFQFDEAAIAFREARNDRRRFRARLLGRGDELQPSALGAARPRGRARACSSSSRRRRQSAPRKRVAEGAGVPGGSGSPVLRARRQARARQGVLGGFGQHVRALARRPRGRDVLRAVAARHGAARRRRASGGKRSRRRSRSKCSRRIRVIPARRISSFTRSTIPITRRSACLPRAPTRASHRRPRTRCTCRRTFSCSSACGPTSCARTSTRTPPRWRSTRGSSCAEGREDFHTLSGSSTAT